MHIVIRLSVTYLVKWLPLLLSLSLFLSPSLSLALSGWLQSPQYPEGYPEDVNEMWELPVPQGFALTLQLIHLDLEESEGCQHDALNISADGVQLASLCGQLSFEELQSQVNPMLHTSGSSLVVRFHSDYSNTERHTGFRAIFSTQDIDECSDPYNECTQFCNNYIGGYYCSCQPEYALDLDNHTCTVNCSVDLGSSTRGSVSSPGHPSSYPEHAACSYRLSIDEGFQLVIDFEDPFDIEGQRGGPCIDSLQIKTPSRVFGPFCGDQAPPSLITGSHQMEILFNTDGYGTNTGFTLTYRAKAKTCPSTVTAQSSLIPGWPQYEYGNKVTVQCDTGFEAAMDSKGDMKTNYTSFCQRTGVWSPIHPCQRVDCGTPLLPESGVLQLVNKKPRTLYQDEIQLKCESKYYKLEGEDVYRCDAQGEWSSVKGSSHWPKCVEVCGEPESKHSDFGRIFGGSEAEPGQIPWQVYVENPKGGGSLISDRWVLTAAHVVEGQHSVLLYGGTADIGNIGSSENVVILESEKIFIHPGYPKAPTSGRRTNYDNDIALVRLKSRVPLGPHLLPICLPERKDDGTLISERLGFVSGWGRTEHGTLSSKLLYVEIPVKDRATCSKRKDGKPVTQTFSENMFCAGEKDKDSCSGDSGGPFFLREFRRGAGGQIERGPFRLYGIVSWGIICQERGYYTKVDNYLDWITETMETEERDEED
ncbi:complement C1s subcomponent-like isoform X1 [Lepisosteus oculatus]|uniref:complement C1s subcomponent-like isoform X1 n=1 Tax=Lepisosteus oculatus TaxID=7918 RepID=UPI00372102BD